LNIFIYAAVERYAASAYRRVSLLIQNNIKQQVKMNTTGNYIHKKINIKYFILGGIIS